MSCLGNLGLRKKNLAANRALLAVVKTCFGTGCCLAGNYFLGMRNNACFGLLESDLSTSRALLTVGKTLFGTGCCKGSQG